MDGVRRRLLLVGLSLAVVLTAMAITAPSASAALENCNAEGGEWLGDTEVADGVSANTNYGIGTIGHAGQSGANIYRYFIKWDMSDLSSSPSDVVIDNAFFYWYVHNEVGVPPHEIAAYGSDNVNWDENVITWNLQPQIKGTHENFITDGAIGWNRWRVDNLVRNQVDNTDNVTIVLRGVSEAGGGFIYGYCMEYATDLTLRPYLEIYYHLVGGVNIGSIASQHPLIDRKQDYTGSGALTSTQLTITVWDNEGASNLSLSSVRISIRSVDGTVRVDNVNPTSSAAGGDENTKIFYYTYDPADNLPDAALGLFDVQVLVTDSLGRTDNENFIGMGADLFTVDDWRTTFGLAPNPPQVGYTMSIGGIVSRVSGTADTPSSMMFLDASVGTWTTITLAADNWQDNYTCTGDPLENISVKMKLAYGALDGYEENSYVVSENVTYTIEVRWEENFALVDNLRAQHLCMTVYYENEQRVENFADNVNPDNYNFSSSVRLIVLNHDNDYSRSRVVYGGSGGVVQLFIVGDHTKLREYHLTLYDVTGMFSPPNGRLLIKRYIGTNLAYVNYDWWSSELKVNAWLLENQYYQFDIINATQTRSIGQILADANTDKTVWVRELVAENEAFIYTDIAWSAVREDTGVITVTYQDSGGGTENGAVKIYLENGTLAYSTTFTTSTLSLTWTGADNSKGYVVRLEVDHATFGTIIEQMAVGMRWGSYYPTTGGGENISGMFMPDAPIPFMALASLVCISVIALMFGALHASTGMLVISIMVAMLSLWGWLPVPMPIVALLVLLSVLWKLAERR